ncbi:MAG: TolC family protein [Candidatus Krumholzibacteriota bacterium]|nr:TolC family protein [Candidatus Krumholzibacteriota bacterium]
MSIKKRYAGGTIFILAGLVLFQVSFSAAAKNRETENTRARSIERGYLAEGAVDIGGTLEDYLAFAALNNPELRAAFYEWKSELEHIPLVSGLPDPVLSYGYFVEKVETRVGPQNHRVALRQMFPWFGTLGARSDAAFESANIAYQKYRSKKLQLFFEVKIAYFDYYYLGREIKITRDNMELLQSWESVARTKYKTALLGQGDVIRVQVELGLLEDKLLSLLGRKAPVAARLASALDLPDSVVLSAPVSIVDSESVVDIEIIKNFIVAQNPDLKALEHMMKKAEADIRYSGKSSYPNFTIGIDYIEIGDAINPQMPESGKDPWGINVSISLPIWFEKNSAKKNEARARLEMSKYKLKNRENKLYETAERVLYELEDAGRKIDLYRNGIIPKLEQLLNVTFTAYQAGDTDFMNVIETQRQLLNFRLNLEQALVKKAKVLAEIEVLTGKD